MGRHLGATAASLGMLPMHGDLMVPGAQDRHSTNGMILSQHEDQLYNLATITFSNGRKGVAMEDQKLIRQHMFTLASTVGPSLWANARSERVCRELRIELGLKHEGEGLSEVLPGRNKTQAWCPEWAEMMAGMWARHYGRNYESMQMLLLEAIPTFTDASVSSLTLYQHVSAVVEYALSAGKNEKEVRQTILRKTSGTHKTTLEQLFDQGKSVSELLGLLEMRCEARINAARLKLQQSMGAGHVGAGISTLQLAGDSDGGQPALHPMDQPCPDHFNVQTNKPATHTYRQCRRRLRMESAKSGKGGGAANGKGGKHDHGKRQGNGQGGGPAKKTKTEGKFEFKGECDVCGEAGHRAAHCAYAKELVKRERATKKTSGAVSLAVAASNVDSPAPYMSPASEAAFEAQLDADLAASAALSAAISTASTANTADTVATAVNMECDAPGSPAITLEEFFAGVAERDTSPWE